MMGYNKNPKKFKLKKILFLSIILLFLLLLFLSTSVYSKNTYIPSPPNGKTEGIVNIVYSYEITSYNKNSVWMFDWGDGAYSDWLELDINNHSVIGFHSWSSSGNYSIRVRQFDNDLGESSWSEPLKINIVSDSDFDGWIDDIEKKYSKDINDPFDHPIDTDKDGIPDNSSIDGSIKGDLDDDNDGLDDNIEIKLGTNPKYASDVEKIFIQNKWCFLLDKDTNGVYDFFYDKTQTSSLGKNEEVYFIDIDFDGTMDFSYHPSTGYITALSEEVNEGFPWHLVGLIVVGIIVLIIFVLFKIGFIYIYQEEVVIEE